VTEKLLYLISILKGLKFSAREKGVRPEIKRCISKRVGAWFIRVGKDRKIFMKEESGIRQMK
jgi:hypothetical protein